MRYNFREVTPSNQPKCRCRGAELVTHGDIYIHIQRRLPPTPRRGGECGRQFALQLPRSLVSKINTSASQNTKQQSENASVTCGSITRRGSFFLNNNPVFVPLTSYFRDAIFPPAPMDQPSTPPPLPTHLVDAYCGAVFSRSPSPRTSRMSPAPSSPPTWICFAMHNAELNGLKVSFCADLRRRRRLPS